ncbi:MAG: DinB family protein [Candidatus Acidiferrales bacterium]
MNYYGGKELAASFRTVRRNTVAIASDIPEEKYGFRAAPDTRSVAELLVHIALGFNFQYQVHATERRTTLAGFDFPALMRQMAAEEKTPRTKQHLLEMLRENGEVCAKWMEGLDEGFLSETVQMPPGANPPSRTRFDMILSVKEHEMHHRGQLMLVERILGIVPHLTREMQARHAAAAAKKQ